MTRMLTGIAAVVLVLGGCGGDDDGGEGGSAAVDACQAQCEAQEAAEGCDPIVDLASCRQLCGLLVSGVKSDCRDEFTAYYTCSAELGFMCLGNFVTQDPQPCANAMDQLNACQGSPMCAGANDAGLCPSVQCPCPDGTTSVSGFSNEGGECSCFDERTCVDFFCD